MTTLIACVSTGKGTWTKVLQLIAAHDWENIILITNSFGKEKFQINKDAEYIILNENMSIKDMINTISDNIKSRTCGFEVALNIESGTGKEHMAIISAILKQGLAMRLVHFDKEIQEI